MRKLLILLGVIALVGVGCGSGSGSESKPLTKEAYQAQLAQTAREIGDKVGKTQNDIATMSDADLKQFSDVVHEFADELDKINPPTGLTHQAAGAGDERFGDEFPAAAKKPKGTRMRAGDLDSVRHE